MMVSNSIFQMGWVAYLEQHGGLDSVLPHEAHLPPWRSCNQAIGEDDDENNVHLQAGDVDDGDVDDGGEDDDDDEVPPASRRAVSPKRKSWRKSWKP